MRKECSSLESFAIPNRLGAVAEAFIDRTRPGVRHENIQGDVIVASLPGPLLPGFQQPAGHPAPLRFRRHRYYLDMSPGPASEEIRFSGDKKAAERSGWASFSYQQQGIVGRIVERRQHLTEIGGSDFAGGSPRRDREIS